MISDAEKLDVENAITKAENKTSAEIVAVIARASGGYYYVPYMWGALIALAAPWPLIEWTWMPVQTIYLIQLGVFAALALILHYPPLQICARARSLMRKRAHQRAMQQFVAQDIYTTRAIRAFCCSSRWRSAMRKSSWIAKCMSACRMRNGKAS